MNARIPPQAQAAREFAATFTRNVFLRSANPTSVTGLIRKVDIFVDKAIAENVASLNQELDCKPGCDHCCNQVILASIPELVSIFDYVEKEFSEPQRADLQDRATLYEQEAKSLKEGQTRITCPFLKDHLCTIYPVRPLFCRMVCSFEAEACRVVIEHPQEAAVIPMPPGPPTIGDSARQGIYQGLDSARFDARPYDLGRATHAFLSGAASADGLLSGEHSLPSLPPGTPPMMFDMNVAEAHGQASGDASASQARKLFQEGSHQAAQRLLVRPSEAQLLARLSVPEMYASQDEILESRVRFESTLDELLDSKFDPRTMYNELAHHHTFHLAYQGLSVKDTLEKHGELLVRRIAQKALPHLSTPIESVRKPGKLRVGYLSSNLKNSNGGKWALGWLENHGEDIETYALLTGEQRDIVSMQFLAAADHFYHLLGNTQRAAEFVRSLDLDVLIFTDLGMDGKNYQFASLRLSRTQCTAWGHPVTSGLPTIDYYLSSEFMEPDNAKDEYTETLVRLPRSGLFFRRVATHVAKTTREELGLPSGFVAFMGQYLPKWIPSRDELFVKLFEATNTPVVLVGRPAPHKIEARLNALGVPYVMLPAMSAFQYHRALQLADVSFDPVDWSGGNTTVKALSLGTPVVTVPGRYMRGRHSLAFLELAGLQELIAGSDEDYISLIADPERQRKAMEGANIDALFEDIEVVRALDNFLLSLS